jgi:hypothetical protein
VTSGGAENPREPAADLAALAALGSAVAAKVVDGLAALVRAENPETAARLSATGSAFVDALRELFIPGAPASPPDDGPSDPRVQRIDLDTDENG